MISHVYNIKLTRDVKSNHQDTPPRDFEHNFNVNAPVKYHKKVLEEGCLEAAPASLALNHLKDALQAILTAHDLPEGSFRRSYNQRCGSRYTKARHLLCSERKRIGVASNRFIVSTFVGLDKQQKPPNRAAFVIWFCCSKGLEAA